VWIVALVLIAAVVLARWTATRPRFPGRPYSATAATPDDITIRRDYRVPESHSRTIEVEFHAPVDAPTLRAPMRKRL
jgi:hypothetical protein